MTDERFERWIALVLIVGVGASSALIAAGFAASFVVGWTGSIVGVTTPATDATDFSNLASRLVALQPLAIVELGLILLATTPVVRVMATTFGFWREHDWLYFVLSIVVICLLIGSFVLLR